MPRSDYTIDDNWQVIGLCGTGSKDIVVEDAFVPEYRTHSYLDAFYLRNPSMIDQSLSEHDAKWQQFQQFQQDSASRHGPLRECVRVP